MPILDEWRAFPAPAKLNLFLHVVGRRADGYHLLQSLLTYLDFHDTVHLRATRDGVIRRSHALDGVRDEDDLSIRAARLLQSATGCSYGAEIRIDKRIPLGGGLGGGSSDAATTLLALNHLWATRFTRAQLQELALRLGADVPFFVFGSSAWVEGIGERLTAFAAQAAWYAVLHPGVAVATSSVFADPTLTRDTPTLKIEGFAGSDLQRLFAATRNDLEPVVRRRETRVAECLDWLQHQAAARMTGSGACVFAAFGNEAEARRVFAQRPPAVAGFVARSLNRHPIEALL